ncbi:EF2563 family selenium-dependent molybdenum hydroxylase system protein [Deltaproteobacteria bacterium OttesenSCG-928-M10]|nr:EF2563 family selenium-dependent molybdenum hydroxylase system protein [Deltaproteobacteria bacterium OttesenSCG-928-M10]
MNQQFPLFVIVKGAGDLATGVAHRLHQAGCRLLLTDLARPTAIRRTVAFSQAVYDGEATVEGLTSVRAGQDNFRRIMDSGRIPVLTEADNDWLDSLGADALIEATLSKRNTGLRRLAGRVTVALGPGYTAGREADAVVETARGHYLGRVILDGPALPNTGKPGLIGGYDLERLIKSPAAGEVVFDKQIGDLVKAGESIGRVGGASIVPAIGGILRGALTDGLTVPADYKIGDVDPRPEAAAFIHSISDKARAVAGGALEALMYFTFGPGRRPVGRSGTGRR